MKVLLRKFGDAQYVWQDAHYDENGIVSGMQHVYETNIVALTDDEADNHFQCSICGKVFSKANEEEWRKHITKRTDIEKCFECRYLKSYNPTSTHVTYERQGNGLFKKIQVENEAVLKCNVSYYSRDITNLDTHENCCHNRCVNATKISRTNFFSTHPEAFDTIISVNKILEAGYKEKDKNVYSGETMYTLKGKNKIQAIVNKMSIVDYFVVSYRRNYWNVVYSKKYNKLYEMTYSDVYKEWRPSEMSNETIAYIFNVISKLYSGTEDTQ